MRHRQSFPFLWWNILNFFFHGEERNASGRVPWVFWHKYWSQTKKDRVIGPYKERKRIMRTLCKKAGVKYFRYHALRHFGASVLEQANVPVGSIQRILGHESRTTTEIYLHSIGDSERLAMDVLNESFGEFSHTKPTQMEKGYSPETVTP